MTSYYKYLPVKSSRSSKVNFQKRQSRQYIFALLLFLTLVLMSLYEFYFHIIERSNNGSSEATILQSIICQIFMLSFCPQKDSSVQQLRIKIEDINKLQNIRNFDGHSVTQQTIVIVIQVHIRLEYLNDMIQSLKLVKNINSTIIVFSHDVFSEELNDVVNSIDFAPVLQIFYPFSNQLYPKEFPGTCPNDCKWDMDVEEARAQGCLGASTPDEYGHFRQSEFTQLKHHWWWKMNRVFHKLEVTKNFDGYILFLEEDHYLAKDALHVLQLMIELAAVECPECNSFHIGNFKKPHSYEEEGHKVEVSQWNNLGFSFNRTLWKVLKECSNVFCTFDDYNWDWSYVYTAQECFYKKLTPLVVKASRVFHIGDCGVHHTSRGCSLKKSLVETEAFLNSAKPYLFPTTLVLEKAKFLQQNVKKGWGGWADPRDIQLCLNISNSESVT